MNSCQSMRRKHSRKWYINATPFPSWIACTPAVRKVECGHPLSDRPEPVIVERKMTMRIRVALRSLAISLLVLTTASVAAPAARKADDNGKLEKLARSVTIYRDSYGVPHIFGPTDASCAFGYAYAQAEDNFWQIEESYIPSIGRAWEI